MIINPWPALPLAEWKDTYETLHRWTQIVGKIRLKVTPFLNHWWNCTLYVTPYGLTTSSMTYKGRFFQVDFDFTDHILLIRTSDSSRKTIALRPRSVADFYQEVMSALDSLGISIKIWTTPVEVQDRTPFENDHKHAAYDHEYAQRFWRILAEASRVLTKFRSRFIGKVSPVHFFWGAFDLAVTRFSGRRAPPHPGSPNCARFVMVEAYSHEASSCGFWPGGGPVNEPVFYAYAYPEPQGFKDYPIQPQEAFYSTEMGEFVLPYYVVRSAGSPDEVLLSVRTRVLLFLQPSLVFFSIRLVFFPNWLYIVLAGAVASIFWIMFSFFDQLLFFSPIFVFYLPDDAVIGFILSTIIAILMGIVVSINVYALKHLRALKIKNSLGSFFQGLL